MRKTIEKNYYALVEVSIKKKKRIAPFDLTIASPQDAGKLFSKLIAFRDREVLAVIGLDTKSQVTYFEIAHIGTLSQSHIHPREIFKSSILTNSAAIIMAHNHPSGDVSPSDADRIATNKMISAGDMIGIQVIDHIIIAEDKYYSIKENRVAYLERKADE